MKGYLNQRRRDGKWVQIYCQVLEENGLFQIYRHSFDVKPILSFPLREYCLEIENEVTFRIFKSNISEHVLIADSEILFENWITSLTNAGCEENGEKLNRNELISIESEDSIEENPIIIVEEILEKDNLFVDQKECNNEENEDNIYGSTSLNDNQQRSNDNLYFEKEFNEREESEEDTVDAAECQELLNEVELIDKTVIEQTISNIESMKITENPIEVELPEKHDIYEVIDLKQQELQLKTRSFSYEISDKQYQPETNETERYKLEKELNGEVALLESNPENLVIPEDEIEQCKIATKLAKEVFLKKISAENLRSSFRKSNKKMGSFRRPSKTNEDLIKSTTQFNRVKERTISRKNSIVSNWAGRYIEQENEKDVLKELRNPFLVRMKVIRREKKIIKLRKEIGELKRIVENSETKLISCQTKGPSTTVFRNGSFAHVIVNKNEVTNLEKSLLESKVKINSAQSEIEKLILEAREIENTVDWSIMC